MVHTKTYMFTYFYSQYLVLFTTVWSPVKVVSLVSCVTGEFPSRKYPFRVTDSLDYPLIQSGTLRISFPLLSRRLAKRAGFNHTVSSVRGFFATLILVCVLTAEMDQYVRDLRA